MYEDAVPSKRKNDDYRESLFSMLLRFLGRVMVFLIKFTVVIPARWLWRATVWTAIAPFRLLRWLLHGLNILINGRIPEFETVREREIYLRVKRRYRRRSRFITHVFAFVLVNGIMWIEWFSRPDYYRPQSGPAYVGITLIWAFFLLFHHMRVRLGNEEDDAMEAAFEREYQREARLQPVYYEEVDEYYGDHAAYRHLTDAGVSGDNMPDLPKAKRRRNAS